MNKRIIPLNLPAGLEREIAGNPVITRLESTPANCRPGLDVDIRNLDRRFFPGLLFDFVAIHDGNPDVQKRGVQVMEVDLDDPDLPEHDQELKAELASVQQMLANTTVLLDAVAASGKSMSLLDANNVPFNSPFAWRIVRSLEPGLLIITLSQLKATTRLPFKKLKGTRRRFQKPTGELSDAYQAGELTQSLCSPWQHDYRECACTYWATNHPDIVLAAHPMNITEMAEEGRAEEQSEDPIVWMRWNLEKPVAPRGTLDGSRTLEMDTYEINERWRELPFVLEDREQLIPWVPPAAMEALPLDLHALPDRLQELAEMEHALALEYLYARYTVPFYDDTLMGEDAAHATFIAHELLNVAISEMMHLRWANELLLAAQRLIGKKAVPALRVALEVPRQIPKIGAPDGYEVTMRPTAERPIDEAIDDFVAAEAPSGTIEGQYAKILSRLKKGWPGPGEVWPHLIGMVERIIGDGLGHYSRFREIQAILKRPRRHLLVKHLDTQVVVEGSTEFNIAEDLYRTLIRSLDDAYQNTGHATAKYLLSARKAMDDLDTFATKLAKERGLSVPILQIGYKVTERLP